MIKKLLALTLALAMVLSVSAFAGYKADTYADADKIAAGCEDAVELLYALNIMKGDGKNFNPEASVTRAEMAKMIYVILNYGEDDDAAFYLGAKLFSDVQAGAWYEGYVNYAAATKLVQGRPDGTFGPMDPVTTAEAAKMLLTAIGYSAEARGYTGANWDKNVLSDASVIGLLDGYKSNVNTYAPRQWVAVMMENALNAYTFTTMRPSFSGLLTSGDDSGIVTMGNKYYGIEVFTGVAMATKKTTLYTSDTYSKNGILFDAEYEAWNSKTEKYEDVAYDLEGTGLTVEDLGQEFKVILVDGAVVSVRNTGKSDVAESLIRDIEAKTVTATSGKNWANNRYEFTIDEMVAKFNEDGVNKIVLGTGKDKVKADVYAAKSLYNEDRIGKNDPATLKAIDSDGNGDIDYVVITEYNYAYVDGTGTSRAYGDYVTLTDKDGKAVKAYGGNKWYVEDVINCAETLEKGNYVKYNYNNEDECWDMEILPVVEDEFTRVSKGGIYTIGGETYELIADDYFFGKDTVLAKKNVGDTVIIAVDGEMIVVVKSPADAKATLEEVNEQLVVVLDKTDEYYKTWEHDYAVKYMDINNEEHEAVFLGDQAAYDAIKTVKSVGTDAEGQFMLYILTTNDDGEVKSLKPVMTNFDDFNAEDAYFVWEQEAGKAAANWEIDDKMGADLVELDNTFFVGMRNSKGKLVVEAMTLADLGEVKTGKDARVEGIYELASSKKASTLVGGYFYVGELSGGTDDGYLYVIDTWFDKAEEADMAEVILPDNSTATIELAQDYDSVALNELYTYTYSKYDDVYTLELVEANNADIELALTTDAAITDKGTANELVEAYGKLFYGEDEIFVDTGALYAETWSLEKVGTFALKVVEITRDEATGDDPWNVEEDVELKFVTLDELKEEADILVNGNEITGDIYYTDFHYVAKDILYVISYRVVDAVQ